ncbi:TIGR02677 family protein [Rubrivivax gelatinosus]|nr:TIGR02677 family protein [Rubrivivax gelatinosus]
MKEQAAALFRHVNAEKAALYRRVLDVFTSARRQFRLQLRPDEVLQEGEWGGAPPPLDELNQALQALTEWGNLESQPDMVRSSTLADFYLAKYIYRLSQGGEAVEAGLEVFTRSLRHKAELQSVALEDIAMRLNALLVLAAADSPDVVKVHEALRDLVARFEGLAENARGFMAGIARGFELQRADASTVVKYKKQLIDYIDRFVSDLVRRSDAIAQSISDLTPSIQNLLWAVAEREAQDAAPADAAEATDVRVRRWHAWQERWKGLRGWFLPVNGEPPQSDLLRARARSAIPQLIGAISALNDRRSGRSDRSADFRTLAYWFAGCESDADAHRLARAAFGLNSARHYSLAPSTDGTPVPASTPWALGPSLKIHPRLRQYGEAAPRGPLAKVRDRSVERAELAVLFAEESRQVEAARKRLCTAEPTRLSALGELNEAEFGLFLSLLSDAISEQENPDATVERNTGDGLLRIRLQPLGRETYARIVTPGGVFSGRDHILTISAV